MNKNFCLNEDFEKITDNPYNVVIAATQRAKQLAAGADVAIALDENHKRPVIALEEIAAKAVDSKELINQVIRAHRTVLIDDSEEKEDFDEVTKNDTYNPDILVGDEYDINK